MTWMTAFLIFLGILVATVIASVIHARALSRRWVAKHARQDDAAFLEGCHIARSDDQQSLALAVRRALAAIVKVPPESIAADVRMIELLQGLDVQWDDWCDVKCRVERCVGLKIDWVKWQEHPLLQEVVPDQLELRHMIRAAIASSTGEKLSSATGG